jgi:uroporphyrinogen-III decarboxylase
MKRKERFLAALGRKQPDRVPMFDFLFQQPLYEALIGRRPDTYNARDVVECALALDHDAVWLRSVNPEGWEPEYLAPDTYVDEWGTIFRHTDASWPYDSPIDYPIRTHEDLVQYRWPDPTLPGRVDDVKNFWKTQHDDLALTAGVTGPFTKAWFLMGYERICLALYDDPSMLEEIFRLSNEYFKEIVRRLIAAGCDAIWIQEDLGDNTRGFMKLNHFRAWFKKLKS